MPLRKVLEEADTSLTDTNSDTDADADGHMARRKVEEADVEGPRRAVGQAAPLTPRPLTATRLTAGEPTGT